MGGMPDDQDWPLRKLLRDARKLKGFSYADAGEEAGFSGSKWRDIELGHLKSGGGAATPYVPKDDDLLAVCDAVELTPDLVFGSIGRAIPKIAVRAKPDPRTLLNDATVLLSQGMEKVRAAAQAMKQEIG